MFGHCMNPIHNGLHEAMDSCDGWEKSADIETILGALKAIEEVPPAPFSRDPLTHAEATIAEMRLIARVALRAVGRLT